MYNNIIEYKKFMSNLNKYNILDKGENLCSKCSAPMQRREWKILSEKRISQPYYFSEWDVCLDCGMIQMYEKFKVFNKNQTVKVDINKLDLFK